MPPEADEFVVDFPTLWVAIDWIESHCVVADRDDKGSPFVMYDWQLWCTANHYRIRAEARLGQFATAFFFRRSLIVAPQKTGKGPWSAAIVVLEARGPVVFDGWAVAGDVYDCADHGCGCGWVYEYEEGEPKARPWATPLIQLVATSEDQTENVYRHVKVMLKQDHFADEGVTVGLEESRLPNDGVVETVTSNAQSRLGNPIVFVLHDESGTYTDLNKMRKVAETQRRGVAGMGGRSMETTNPWDPSEDSVGQRSWYSKAQDIFRFWRNPDNEPTLRHRDGTKYKFSVARERRKILAYVYRGSEHVDLDAIDAESQEIAEQDPGQAERFFGNREVAGLGHWCSPETWDMRTSKVKGRKRAALTQLGTQIVVGFDGSDVDDLTGFRCQTKDGFQFTPAFADGTPMIWDPAEFGGQVPRLEVSAALDAIMEAWNVARVYADPPYWETEIDTWAGEYGEDIVIRWYTRRLLPMHAAAERLLVDLTKKDSGFSHDGCQITASHVSAARKSPRGVVAAGEERKKLKYVLTKPGDGRKIDMAIPSILANEAHGDVTAAGWPEIGEEFAYFI